MNKITVLILFLSYIGYSQVGIGTTTPNGALEINSATNGVVVSNVALTSRNVSAPVVNPNGGALLAGTLVWNTATAGTSPNNVSPGFYYWDGSSWIAIAGDGGKYWTTTGNSGTTSGTNYIGTNDAVDFRIKTGGNDRWNVSNTNAGQLQSYSLGTATAPSYSFQSNSNTGLFSSSANNLDFSTNGTARIRIPNANQIHALNLGTASLPFYSFSADTGIGMWSPTTSTLAFSTTGVERIRFLADGRVSVNSTSPPATRLFSVTADATNTTAICGISAQAAPAILGQTTSSSSFNGAVQGEYNGSSIFGSGVVAFAGNTVAGTDFIGNTVSANYGGLNNSVSRSFGVFGDTFNNLATRTGGVLGTDGVRSGALGYYNSAGTSFAVYGFGQAYTTGGATGRITNPNYINSSIGLGIYGGVIGGWIKGDEYGTVFTGKRFSSYNLGKVISNEDYIVISGKENKIVSYASTSLQPEVNSKGIAKLVNGEAEVIFEKSFSQLVDKAKPIVVTCTPMGETKGVFLAEVSSNGFKVKENQNGNSSAAFSWIAIGEKRLTPNQRISDEILDKDFEANLNEVMHDENLDGGKAIWEQNGKVHFGDKAPENPAKKQKREHKKPSTELVK